MPRMHTQNTYVFTFTGCCVQGLLGYQDIWFLEDLCIGTVFAILGMHRDFYLAQQECRVLTQEEH